jgi:hypothetical protein
MNDLLSNYTNQTDAIGSIAESLSAISCCAQYLTAIMAGLLVLKIYKTLFSK